MRLLASNGFFLTSLSSIGDKLPATVLFNTMIGSVSPEQVATYSESSPGSSPSAYALLSGKPGYNIEYWAAEKDGKTAYYFSSEDSLNDGTAETFRPIQVCKSWIYFTNKVLVPSSSGKVKEVEKVSIPENLLSPPAAPETSPEVEAPAPALVVPIAPDMNITAPLPEPSIEVCVVPSDGKLESPDIIVPAPEPSSQTVPCDTTFANEATKAGLGILATALSQESIQSQLPDPSNVNTLFAPVDSAFFSMLTDLGISITDALALGNKLAGVILYHIHPGEALSKEELGQRTSITTSLGERMNQPDTYTIGVQNNGSSILLTSLKPGDTANIVNELQVCGTKIYVIDKVLLPSATVEGLPDPGPVPSTKLRLLKQVMSTTTGILDAGKAVGVGPLQNCIVTLEAAGAVLNATTDSNGLFRFDNIPMCAIDTGILTILSSQNGQSNTCVDGLSKLPPPYEFIAVLDGIIGNSTGSFPSSSQPLLVSPLSTLFSAPLAPPLTDETAGLLGFNASVDAALDTSSSDPESPVSINIAAINSQTMYTSFLGARTLETSQDTPLEEGVMAIDSVVSSQLANSVNLADPKEIERILNEAAVFSSESNQSTDSNTNVSSQNGTLDGAYLQSVSKSIAALNQVAKETLYSPTLDLQTKASIISECTILMQKELSPAIGDLYSGQLTQEQFDSIYGSESIRGKLLAISEPPVPALPPNPIQVEQQASSVSRHDFWHLGTVLLLTMTF
jgi:uncharacterized surface protein with fasciclin (FAS1) repeats